MTTIKSDVEFDRFKRLSQPLMDFLAIEHHPHMTIIITSDSAQLVEGIASHVNIAQGKFVDTVKTVEKDEPVDIEAMKVMINTLDTRMDKLDQWGAPIMKKLAKLEGRVRDLEDKPTCDAISILEEQFRELQVSVLGIVSLLSTEQVQILNEKIADLSKKG